MLPTSSHNTIVCDPVLILILMLQENVGHIYPDELKSPLYPIVSRCELVFSGPAGLQAKFPVREGTFQ